MLNDGFVPDRTEDHSESQMTRGSGDINGPSEKVELQLDNVNKTFKEDPIDDDDEDAIIANAKNIVAVGLESFWNNYHMFISRHRRVLMKAALIIAIILIIVYMAAVIWQFQLKENVNTDWCHGYGFSFIIFGLLVWTVLYYNIFAPFIIPYFTRTFHCTTLLKIWRKSRVIAACGVVILLVAFLIWDTSSNRRRLISVGGLIVFICCGFIFSKHPTRVKWKTVYMGLLIQFIIGLLAIRWKVGRQVFKCIGNLAEKFLEYAYVGATLVYGERIVRQDAVFAFQFAGLVSYILCGHACSSAVLPGLDASHLSEIGMADTRVVGNYSYGVCQCGLQCFSWND
ncbi:sodium/nucleoside cotransporter 1-like isoform X2 [Homalodisca vitripennis]|uniref:sodium/nucleoside cotransporter 1-like isoform X2 n=1 Tax=Homalodisca vitripennis TaxID=197043 RepID=UPI001EEC390F|nr:sodium/nucleoside cotransporter 1-like isoform X2 [Homalodisca vitripennis]